MGALARLAGVALALACAQPAQAATFVAVGQGTVVCQISVQKYMEAGFFTGGVRETHFRGATDCTEPVQQTAHATVPADDAADAPALDGGLCAGFVRRCSSGLDVRDVGNPNPMTFHLTLVASRDQGWIGAPRECSGVGSHNLECWFEVNELTRWGV